jgi:hypothetical protein
LIGSAGIILSLMRLIEIFNINSLFQKKKDIPAIDNNSTINLSMNNFEQHMVQTMSSQMTNTYLMEYMFFIIKGILKIGKEVKEKMGDPYSIQ